MRDETKNERTFQTPDTRHIIKLSNYLGHENDTVNNIQVNWAAGIYRSLLFVFLNGCDCERSIEFHTDIR